LAAAPYNGEQTIAGAVRSFSGDRDDLGAADNEGDDKDQDTIISKSSFLV
jgi:hypothetical protein